VGYFDLIEAVKRRFGPIFGQNLKKHSQSMKFFPWLGQEKYNFRMQLQSFTMATKDGEGKNSHSLSPVSSLALAEDWHLV
jgi:hypothetical protein